MSPTKLDKNAAVRRIDELLANSSDDPIQPNCRSADPELFFPRSQVPAVAHDAIEVCTDCAMKTACLAYAMAWDVDGIWGATTKPERDRRREELGRRPLPINVPTIAGTARHRRRLDPSGTPAVDRDRRPSQSRLDRTRSG